MFRIALCDDDKEILELVRENVAAYCTQKEIQAELITFDDSDLLADVVERKHIYDAYILDIEMQDYSGIELAAMIKERSALAYIILLTAYSNYAVYACGRGIFRYVLKETMESELPRVLDSLFEALEQVNNNKYYIVQNQRRYLKFLHRDVVYICREQKNVKFVLTDGKSINERTTLEKVYKTLSTDEDFFQLDRGFILNLFHVKGISNGSIKMDNGFEIISSAKHIEELKKHINRYLGRIL